MKREKYMLGGFKGFERSSDGMIKVLFIGSLETLRGNIDRFKKTDDLQNAKQYTQKTHFKRTD